MGSGDVYASSHLLISLPFIPPPTWTRPPPWPPKTAVMVSPFMLGLASIRPGRDEPSPRSNASRQRGVRSAEASFGGSSQRQDLHDNKEVVSAVSLPLIAFPCISLLRQLGLEPAATPPLSIALCRTCQQRPSQRGPPPPPPPRPRPPFVCRKGRRVAFLFPFPGNEGPIKLSRAGAQQAEDEYAKCYRREKRTLPNTPRGGGQGGRGNENLFAGAKENADDDDEGDDDVVFELNSLGKTSWEERETHAIPFVFALSTSSNDFCPK